MLTSADTCKAIIEMASTKKQTFLKSCENIGWQYEKLNKLIRIQYTALANCCVTVIKVKLIAVKCLTKSPSIWFE
jgi:hypothetical protein